jgi:ribosomal protein L21
MKNKAVNKLLSSHHNLNHSENMKVVSHVQRDSKDWIVNTLMIDGCDVPFKYKRKKKYKNSQGQRVNLTYYPAKENIAGIEMEIMKVVRIKIA